MRVAGQIPSWLLPVLLLASAWSSNAAAGEWKSSDWTVECLLVSEGTCRATEAAGAGAYYERTLEDAGQWLRGLGFQGPEIYHDPDLDSYMGYISDTDNEDSEGHRKSIGVYYPGLDKFYLTSDRYFALGQGDTPQERAVNLANDIEYTATVVHELFHGVQHAYYPSDASPPDWIQEGMAKAVQLAWVRRTLSRERVRVGTRTFDQPLHKPKDSSDAYETARFWRGVGKILGSRDDIQYLHVVLAQKPVAGTGLSGVDKGLRVLDPAALYNLYPEFIARFTDHARFFDDVGRVSLVYDDSSRVEKSVPGSVREVAAGAHEVSVHVPAGETAKLEIEIADDHDNLHLIVDGKRLDESTGPGRNVFHTTIDGRGQGRTFLVRVANVARQAAATDPRRYRLDFTLQPTAGKSRCTFTATAHIEPIPPTLYVVDNGKKVLIERTVTVSGTATIDDRRHVLTVAADGEDGSERLRFNIDISPLGIGGPEGQVTTRGDVGFGPPVPGDYRVQLDITQNADPGDLAGWDEMTLGEQIDSGVGYPNRLAMRRLRGGFRATRVGKPDCCVGYVQTISGTFDAGNGPYQCEGGVEMMKKAYDTMLDRFNDTPGRKADPGKLDGLLD